MNILTIIIISPHHINIESNHHTTDNILDTIGEAYYIILYYITLYYYDTIILYIILYIYCREQGRRASARGDRARCGRSGSREYK